MEHIAGWLQKGRQLQSQVSMLYSSLGDPRVPWHAKLLVLLVVAYMVSPIDLIPDFIPVIGLLDEAILLPIALVLIMRLIPEDVARDHQAAREEKGNVFLKTLGAVMVVSVWVFLLVVCYRLSKPFFTV